MRRPRIGLNTGLSDDGKFHQLHRYYVEMIVAAGGLPVVLPFSDRPRGLLAELDGVVFTGGRDMNPRRWRERKHPKAVLLPAVKEESDVRAMRAALDLNKPVLGICYGMQLLNVVRGGSLHQHLPDVVGRRIEHREGAEHDVEFVKDSRLARSVRKPGARVRSYHHQAVNRLGRGLAAVATAPDGIVEAIEDPARRFLIGVQWHPERIMDRPEQRALVAAFIGEASR